MTPEAADELILRHLEGETSPRELDQVTSLLADNLEFRNRFCSFVSLVALIREILDNRLDGKTPVEVGMGTPLASPRVMARIPAAPLPEPARPALPDLNLDFRRLFSNALLSGFGGLLGWLVYSFVNYVMGIEDVFHVYFVDAIKGLFFGVCIGFAVGCTEGLGSRSLPRALRGGTYGAVLGAVGGVAGLVLGELIYNLARGGIWPRAVGWGIFGMLVGISEGVARRLPVKVRYGILGGLLGGLIGGSTYEGLVNAFVGIGSRSGALAWGSAIGLIILGACIGFLVSLVENLLRKAWVFFLTGRLEGQTRTLDSSRPHTIGSDPSCAIVIPSDPSVAGVHAEFSFDNEQCSVRARDGQVILRRDGVDQPVTAHLLAAGDRIILGETRMVFRNVEGKKS